jgi:hypothetical protein
MAFASKSLDADTKGLQMAAYKKTRITVENEQVLIIRRRGCARRWCWECGREAEMVEFAQAAALSGVAQRSIRDVAKKRKWHLAEAVDGTPLICLDSLLNSARAKEIDPDRKETREK